MEKTCKFNLRVLIVDDQPLMITMLRQILKQLGFTDIREAEDGNAALAIIQNDKIGLVFTDLNMPALSGLDLIQKIRQKAATKDLPVIVVSGEYDQGIVLKAMEAGANSFIIKPFATKTIREKILQVICQQRDHLIAPD